MGDIDELFDIDDPEWKTDFIQVFEELDAEWYRETAFHSNISKMCEHPNYKKLVDFGLPTLIVILEKMHSNKKFSNWGWFPALSEISGENPIQIEDRGSAERIMYRWIEWGIKNGYLCS